MSDLIGNIKSYYREKRIQRILLLLEPATTDYDRKGKLPLINRDTKVRFLLTYAALVILSIPIRFLTNLGFPQVLSLILTLVASVLAVEASDYVWLRMYSFFDRIISLFVPIAAVVFVISAFVFKAPVSKSRKIEDLKNSSSTFQAAHLNAKKAEQQRLLNTQSQFLFTGKNWFIVLGADGSPEKMSAADGLQKCLSKGASFNFPTMASIKNLTPAPRVPPSTTLWMRGGTWSGIFSGEITSPPANRSPDESKASVICVVEQ